MDHANADQEDLNRSTWSRIAAQNDLLRGDAFSDPGERAALAHALRHVQNTPFLDLGVGMGRTISMLEPLASEYRALDFVPEMVEASRHLHPATRIDVGDARTLADVPDGHFGLVVFSYNGIDAVPAADRHDVLRAVRRVLRPGGLFFFSTLNLDGPSYRERPWKLRVWSPGGPAGFALQVLRQIAGSPLDLVHWMKIRHGGEHGPGFAVAPLSAHHYGVLAHYTTLARQLNELTEEGFAPDPAVFSNVDGERFPPVASTHDVDWFHFVACRP